MLSDDIDVINIANNWKKNGKKVALATVIQTWGSAPRGVGSKLVIDQDGNFEGSVSGGCVEGAVINEAMELFDGGTPKVLEFGVSNEMAWEVGLACGGELKVLIQPLDIQDKIVFSIVDNIKNREAVKLRIDCSNGLRIIDNTLTNQTSLYDKEKNEFIHVIDPKPRLFVVGAVHIAQALISLAAITDFEIILIDPREHFATEKRFPNCKILTEWPDIALSRFNLDKSTHLVTLTHDPKIDDPALIYSLKKNIGYIGSLGSKKTHQKRCERLTSLGFSDNDINKIHAPIGLDIKGKTPAEIAVSIIAEIISFRRKSHDSN